MEIPRERAVTADVLTRAFASFTKCRRISKMDYLNTCLELEPSHKDWSKGLCEYCLAITYTKKWPPFPILAADDPPATCQLCTSGVPVSEIRDAHGHSISFVDRPAVIALWVPCSDNDRQLARKHEETLRSAPK